VRILSWNILQGGGRRSRDIIDTLASLDADVIALQEFRHGKSKGLLLDGFNELGYEHQYLPEPTGNDATTANSVGLISRYPIEDGVVLPVDESSANAPLAIKATVSIIDSDAPDIEIVVVHLPHKQKQLPYFDTLQNLPASMRSEHSLLIGDFNCGIPFEDSETKSFHATQQFQSLLAKGWTDAWRSRHPDAREFSWVSVRKGNGYRYDHALVSEPLNERIGSVFYEHEPREKRISDHSVLLVDLD